MTDPPATTITYASVISRELVRIALTLSALNNMKVLTADILGAYLMVPCNEKIWLTCSPEFRPEGQGTKAIIKRALYRLKSTGASFRNHVSSCLQHLGLTSCNVDPDVWMRQVMRPDGGKCYKYLFMYVDDVLAIGLDPKMTLEQIDKYFQMKPGLIAKPDIYLGAKIRSITQPDSSVMWAQSASLYCQEAMKNIECWHEENGYKLGGKLDTPVSTSYHPEMDVSKQLSDDEANWYQSVIPVLQWAIELRRFDIMTEVSMLASQMAMPWKGHLYAVLCVFTYLKCHHNS